MAANLYIDSKGLGSIQINLQRVAKQIPGATASALNRTLDFTTTRTIKEVTNEYTVKNKTVKQTIKKVRAKGNSLYAYISSTGPTISLAKFQHTPRRAPANAMKFGKGKKIVGKGYQVKVKVKKTDGYKVINTNPKAFVQKINGDEAEIYMRKGSKRFPVIKLRSLSVPQMIANEKIIKSVQEVASQKLQERINHEIEWRLNKLGGK
ncbi:MAG: phage tail protein [Clostridiaceae bacterium]